MKHFLLLLAVVFTIGLSTAAMDAQAAKRLGSGKSMGTQRQATQDKAAGAAAPSTAAAPAAGGAVATPSRSSWMGPVAGLAAGLGLAALASHLGFGGELASMVMMGLLAIAVMMAIGLFMRKRAAAQPSNTTGPGGMQYAHVNPDAARNASKHEQNAPAYKVLMPASGGSAIGSGIGSGIGTGIGANTMNASRIPSDFDTAGFERNAKVNFIRLQAANDAGDLDDIRDFTTPGMFAELRLEIAERGTAIQKTEVVSINAEVMEVDEGPERYLVSVRFTGAIQDGAAQSEQSFDEIWHLMKPRQGSSGWVLSGIQQMPSTA